MSGPGIERKLSEAEVIEIVSGYGNAFDDGGPNMRAESITLAEKNGFNVDTVNEYWDGLEEGRLARQAEQAKAEKAAADKLVRERFAAQAKAKQVKHSPKVEVREPKRAWPRTWAEVQIPEGASRAEALTYVPGVVGGATEWMVACARRPNRMMALGSSLAVAGTVMGRVVIGPTESATHLLLAILLPSGWGKDSPLKCGEKVIELVLGRDALSSGQFASAPGLELDLLRGARRISFADELGDELTYINTQKGNALVSKLIGTLKKLYNAWDTIITASTVARGESKTIFWPAYSVVGAATPEKFYGALTPSDLESGFVNRWLALPHAGAGRPRERKPTGDKDNPPEELLKALQALPREKPLLEQKFDVPPERQQVGWGVGAEDVYFEFSGKMDDFEDCDKQRFELGMRTVENAIRLATIVAVGRGSAVVDIEDMQWAIKLSELALDTMLSDINRYMVEYLEFPRLCSRVFETIASRPRRWMSSSKLFRRHGRNQKYGNELERVKLQLVREGRLIPQKGRDGERGPEVDGWLALEDDDDGETDY
jgi:hypothetical protein